MANHKVRTEQLSPETANGIKELCKKIGLTQQDLYESDYSIYNKYTFMDFQQILNGRSLTLDDEGFFVCVYLSLKEKESMYASGEIEETLEQKHKRELKNFRYRCKKELEEIILRHREESADEL